MLTQRPIRHARPRGSRGGPFAAALLAISAGWLGGCAPRRADTPVPPPPADAAAVPVPAGAESYDIVAGRSHLTLYVRRAGPLARLGHNHVITSDQLTGAAWLGRGPTGAGFEVRVPVASFVVDDPVARSAAGAEFAGEVPAEARAGTQRNLLRPEVLDAERFPEVTVRATGLAGAGGALVGTAQVTLRGVTRPVEVPMELERSANTLGARGTFRIRQTDFGMAPFSVAGGAVQVADEIEIRFDVVAVRR